MRTRICTALIFTASLSLEGCYSLPSSHYAVSLPVAIGNAPATGSSLQWQAEPDNLTRTGGSCFMFWALAPFPRYSTDSTRTNFGAPDMRIWVSVRAPSPGFTLMAKGTALEFGHQSVAASGFSGPAFPPSPAHFPKDRPRSLHQCADDFPTKELPPPVPKIVLPGEAHWYCYAVSFPLPQIPPEQAFTLRLGGTQADGTPYQSVPIHFAPVFFKEDEANRGEGGC